MRWGSQSKLASICSSKFTSTCSLDSSRIFLSRTICVLALSCPPKGSNRNFHRLVVWNDYWLYPNSSSNFFCVSMVTDEHHEPTSLPKFLRQSMCTLELFLKSVIERLGRVRPLHLLSANFLLLLYLVLLWCLREKSFCQNGLYDWADFSN